MEAVCSSETLVSTYKSAWHWNPEENHLCVLSGAFLVVYIPHLSLCLFFSGTYVHFCQRLGRSPTEATRLRFDQDKSHFTVAYWSNLQFVMALLPPAR
jgi:hypothetical protein